MRFLLGFCLTNYHSLTLPTNTYVYFWYIRVFLILILYHIGHLCHRLMKAFIGPISFKLYRLEQKKASLLEIQNVYNVVCES